MNKLSSFIIIYHRAIRKDLLYHAIVLNCVINTTVFFVNEMRPKQNYTLYYLIKLRTRLDYFIMFKRHVNTLIVMWFLYNDNVTLFWQFKCSFRKEIVLFIGLCPMLLQRAVSLGTCHTYDVSSYIYEPVVFRMTVKMWRKKRKPFLPHKL
jgi:hypothetical protein